MLLVYKKKIIKLLNIVFFSIDDICNQNQRWSSYILWISAPYLERD